MVVDLAFRSPGHGLNLGIVALLGQRVMSRVIRGFPGEVKPVGLRLVKIVTELVTVDKNRYHTVLVEVLLSWYGSAQAPCYGSSPSEIADSAGHHERVGSNADRRVQS